MDIVGVDLSEIDIGETVYFGFDWKEEYIDDIEHYFENMNFCLVEPEMNIQVGVDLLTF